MTPPDALDPPRPRAIASWRLATGILLHFAVPAYLLACLAAWLLARSRPGSVEGMAELMIATLPPFVLGYGALMVAAGVLAQAGDVWAERRRPRESIAEAEAAARVDAALVRLRRLANDGGATRLGAVTARLADGWDHADPEQQAIGRDLAHAAAIFSRAHAEAPSARPELLALAADGLDRLAAARDAAAERRRAPAIDAARTAAAYLTSRYGTGDLDAR